MDAARKGSLTKKVFSSSQGTDNKSAKKTQKPKKRKSKKRIEKDTENGKGSSSPQSPEGEDPPSGVSDNPDVESDSPSTKELSESNKPTNAGSTRVTSPKQQSISAKSKAETNTKTVAPYQSTSNTKTKKIIQSSQSNRLKDSPSQGSLSSKSSKSSCNISTGSSKTSLINQSLSRTQLAGEILTKKPSQCESLRWENACDDSDEENERMKQYKLNRRKRYLAAANQKYSEWVKTLSGSTHSLTSNTSDYNSGSMNNSSHESLHKPTSSQSTAYVKTINSSHTVQEGIMPGLATNISVHRGGSQVMLNC